jgi:hypothetical protein
MRHIVSFLPILKGHGNEADFLGFLQKLVPHRSLTLPFELFQFWLRIRGDIHNRKTTTESPSRRVGFSMIKRKLGEWESRQLPDSASRRVVFRLWISSKFKVKIRQNGSKRSVRDLCRTGLCKNPRKSASLPCPFKTVCESTLMFSVCRSCRVRYSSRSDRPASWRRRSHTRIWRM